MKAIITQQEESYKIRLCNGISRDLSAEQIIEFLKTYDDKSQYIIEDGFESLSNELDKISRGVIISVTDDYQLIFHSHDFFHEHILPNKIDYMTAEEFAEKHDRNIEVIRRYCRNNKIDGVYKDENTWYIPKTAECPVDGRSMRKNRKKSAM